MSSTTMNAPLNAAEILLIAMLLDAILGEPEWLWRRLVHPAVLMGRAVTLTDKLLNRGAARRLKGVGAIGALVGLASVLGWAITRLPDGELLQIIVTAILLAQCSLAQHVRAVARALRTGVPQGRRAVARIVGRDTGGLDQPAVARAAIESGAENLSDGVIAPIFWFLVAGLPGLMAYKITNTADSMIGYLSPRYRQFGWAAARLDDVLNWLPARLTALLIALVKRAPDIGRIILRDAPLHRSPNAGWPEAAMASALDVSLAGPRSYDGSLRDFPFVNAHGRRQIGPDDVDAAVRVLWRVWGAVFILVALLAIALRLG